MPALFAGLQLEGNEVIVGRFKEQIIAPDADSAISDVCAALCLPVVVPELTAIARIQSPDVIWSCGIQNPIHHQNCAFFSDTAWSVLFETFTADDRAVAGCGIEAAGPRERKVFYRVAIRLLQGAVASAGVITGVGGPRI